MTIYSNIAEHIAKHGHSLMAVAGDDEAPPFHYTIGLAQSDLPELLIIGFSGPAGLLYDLAKRQLDTRTAFAGGDEYHGEGWNCGVRFVAAPDRFRDLYTIQASRYLGRKDYALLQVVLPDPQGRWPDDRNCDNYYRTQLAWRKKALH